VKVDLSSLKIFKENRIKLNGKPLDSKKLEQLYIELTKGMYEIEF
jgi:hypothetical protein